MMPTLDMKKKYQKHSELNLIEKPKNKELPK